MAGKQSLDGRFREQDALRKRFDTQYYNAAMHKAAFTAPEFFSKALL
jgi:spermidine synthase